jgi:hypothetical protein
MATGSRDEVGREPQEQFHHEIVRSVSLLFAWLAPPPRILHPSKAAIAEMYVENSTDLLKSQEQFNTRVSL